jgi:hypothetical protein
VRECCSRAGRYPLQRLLDDRGRDAKLVDWLDEITADCPKKRARNFNDSAARGARICRACCSSARTSAVGEA